MGENVYLGKRILNFFTSFLRKDDTSSTTSRSMGTNFERTYFFKESGEDVRNNQQKTGFKRTPIYQDDNDKDLILVGYADLSPFRPSINRTKTANAQKHINKTEKSSRKREDGKNSSSFFPSFRMKFSPSLILPSLVHFKPFVTKNNHEKLTMGQRKS